jgi:hypothetical protein
MRDARRAAIELAATDNKDQQRNAREGQRIHRSHPE